jgi:lipopolysaccharide/colanic/teichoic acid biosynthesis glycosyltransferase
MKRTFDVVVSVIALLVASPLLCLLAALIAREDGFPVLFRQTRIGRDGRPFRIVKFRTMRASNGPSITVAGDHRITRLGRWLRRWKLDELPQLWNVVRGEMSLVGPRPEIPEYVSLYPADARRVLAVRPGITGAAQVEGIDEEEELRSAVDPERFYREVLLPRKLEIDMRYAASAGLAADLSIIFRTVRRMLSRPSGASHATE